MTPIRPILLSLVALGLLLSPLSAEAITYDLKAGLKTLTMPDGSTVQMWGFGLAADAEVSVPGPRLEVPPGDTQLIINLTNNLPVATSIVIPALPAVLNPRWNDGTSGPRTALTQRVLSFAQPAAPGGTASYQWDNIRAGTYLYHSGTHPAVQVQMGLYGVMKHDAGAGLAYTGVNYDRELILLYSEIDPALHTAVATGKYGTAEFPSPVSYRARYFLVNGQAASQPPAIPAGNVNEKVLIRFLNAGLKTVIPALEGRYLSLLAEDGQLYPFPLQRYSLLLAAGKTRDALFVPTSPGTVALHDRSLRMTNGINGGAVVLKLQVGTAAGAPEAVGESYTLAEDGSLDTATAGLAGVLANDTGATQAVLADTTQAGTLTLNADGSFIYQPKPDFFGTDFFTYRASNGTLLSNLVTVELKVTGSNDLPMAMADSYQTAPGIALDVTAPGVLGNDHDHDGDTLTAELVTGAGGGTLTLQPTGAFNYRPAAGTTSDSFTYRVFDGTGYSMAATVTITVVAAANQPPIAVGDSASTTRNTPVNIDVAANDSDPEGSLSPATVKIVDNPSRGGTVVANSNGTVTFTPKLNFLGTDTFTYVIADSQGLWSAPATVQVNVVRP